MSCVICCERRPIILCPSCDFIACKQCVKKYLLSVDNPSCMNCNSVWNHDHLVKGLGLNFIKTKLKDHTSARFEREERLNFKYYNSVSKRVQSERETEVWITKLQCEITEQTRNLVYLKVKLQKLINTDHTCGELLHNCPRMGCNGYIDKSLSCSSCLCILCDICMEERVHLHTCDPNIIKSIDVINKTTRPCPSCHLLITRSEGCDQMWCTYCHKTFSWKTNKLIYPTLVHNPHYIEFKNATCSFEWHEFVRLCEQQHVIIPISTEHYFMASKILNQTYKTKIDQSRQRLESLGVQYILKEISHTIWKRRMYNYKLDEHTIRVVIQHVNLLVSRIYQLIHSMLEKNDPTSHLESACVDFNVTMQHLSLDSKYKPHVSYIDSSINIKTHDC
jgi:hypothetical protein